MLEIVQIPCLTDNYGYLVHDPVSNETISIDSPDAKAIATVLRRRQWQLTAIWNTHHHYDHIGGNRALTDEFGCKIYAPAGDAAHIPEADIWVKEGDTLMLGQHAANVLHTPGHTMGHVCYFFASPASLPLAFVGDTLFSLGCGRMFEGTAEDMWPSLEKLRALPGHTRIYCAHEYTNDNLRFALSVDADNPALQKRAGNITQLHMAGKPNVPFTLAEELATNPFLRADDRKLCAALGLQPTDPVRVFAELRSQKDRF